MAMAFPCGRDGVVSVEVPPSALSSALSFRWVFPLLMAPGTFMGVLWRGEFLFFLVISLCLLTLV